MAVAVPSREEGAVVPSPVTAAEAAALGADDVLARLRTGSGGLPEAEAARRLAVAGPNAVRTHRTRALPVLASQLRSPLLLLLAVTALASAFLGQASDAVIIAVILAASVGLGFANEYKAARTAEALHSGVRHSCVTRRDGHPRPVDVTELVPGDVVDLQLGQVVPADLRLLAGAGLECDESVLTGESLPAEKSPGPAAAGTPLAVGTVLPFTPLAHFLGFRPLPGPFFLFLIAAIVSYLALIEVGKHWFYRLYRAPATPAPRRRIPGHRVHRRAARFTARSLRPARRPAEGSAPNVPAV